jgi:hypothetical protein
MKIDQQLADLLDQLRALRKATPDPTARQRLGDQIENLDEQMESLIDKTWDQSSGELRDATDAIGKATDAAGAAKKDLTRVGTVLALADEVVSAVADLIGVKA